MTNSTTNNSNGTGINPVEKNANLNIRANAIEGKLPKRIDKMKFFDVAHDATHHLIPIIKDGIYGYYNELDRTYFTNPDLKSAYSFEPGVKELAMIRINGKLGYIDTDFNVVIPTVYEEAHFFSKGYAAVKVGDKWGYIDTNGNYLIEPKIDIAWDFKDNYLEPDLYITNARVVIDGERYLLDTNGELTKYNW